MSASPPRSSPAAGAAPASGSPPPKAASTSMRPRSRIPGAGADPCRRWRRGFGISEDVLPGAVVSACAYESSGMPEGDRRGLPSPWMGFIVSVDGPVRVSGTVDRGRPFRPCRCHVVRRDRGRTAPRCGPGRAASRADAECNWPCTRSPRQALLGCGSAELLGPGDHGHEVLGRAAKRSCTTGSVRGTRPPDGWLDEVEKWLRSPGGRRPAYLRADRRGAASWQVAQATGGAGAG